MLWKEHYGMTRQSLDKEISLETINHLSRNWHVGLKAMWIGQQEGILQNRTVQMHTCVIHQEEERMTTKVKQR